MGAAPKGWYLTRPMGTDIQSMRAEAERCVKRGELREALSLYEQIIAASPSDAAAAARAKTIGELVAADGGGAVAPRPGRVEPAPEVQSAEQRAEAMFERGDHAGALRTYAEILRIRPDHELARERHNQISALVASPDGHSEQRAPQRAQPQTREQVLVELRDRIASRRRPAAN